MTNRKNTREQGARNLMLGTAGHIDHGKSSLVLALTGTDPDRLAEEKERGITINLGFAKLDLPDGRSMGVVDVPGHEKFVRQMIAGASGIDVALLCIAADDGIMPQTSEHLAVLELLGVPACVVALTKIDLVDDEWAAFMADEAAAALEGTRYAGAPVVGVSSRDGRGLDELKQAIAHAARVPVHDRATGGARMPIDRAFTIKGAGTVVTGTLWSGSVARDDELEVLPAGLRARVRSVQVHGEDVAEAAAGMRVALNLNALKTSEVRPGDFLATPGSVAPSDRFDAWFTYLGAGLPSDKPLETGARVHVAHGTREVTGRVLFMDGRERLAARESCYAQVRLDTPLPLSYDDRFVVRSYSPVHVIGGGRVLARRPRRRTVLSAHDAALLDALAAGDIMRACEAALALQKHPASPERIAADVGVEEHLLRDGLAALVDAKKALRLGEATPPCLAARDVVARDLSALENALLRFHAENPLQPGESKAALHARAFGRMDGPSFQALLDEAARAGRIVMANGLLSHPKAAGGAKAAEENAARAVLDALEKADAMPPAIDDIVAGCGCDAALAKRAVGVLERAGDIVKADKALYFARSSYDALEDAVRAHLQACGQASASELKDAMGLTRKYAMPLLELMDERGVTVRDGDTRRLRTP